MARRAPQPIVAAGPGPIWLRLVLAVLALLYFAALLHHPGARWLRPVTFFTEATALFPGASTYALEWRIEAWRCGASWEAMDPRPYFPIEPDDKESRFQRLGHFYFRDGDSVVRPVVLALDAYVTAGHAAGADDGVAGPIGGIRLVKVMRPIPPPTETIERYHYDPFAAIPPSQRHDLYATPSAERKRRCSS